jgi:AraC-like DNA-binding protein
MSSSLSCIGDEVYISKASNIGVYNMPGLHYHNAYEIYFLESGQRDYIINDKYFRISGGDFVLISPFEMHRTGGESYKRILINFSSDYLFKHYTPSVAERMISCFEKKLIRPSYEKIDYLRILLERLLNEDNKNSDNLIFLYLGDLLLKLNECGCESEELRGNAPNYRKISEITQYISENFSEIENISQIAEHFYITKFHLCRLFKNSVGVTLVDYINNIRIKNACYLLTHTKKSIIQICFDCGFKSSNYFSNLFKKHIKMTPTCYRKLNKK